MSSVTTEIRTFNALDHTGIDQDIRVVQMGGNPWFVVKDIARVLDSDKPNNYTRNLDSTEKGVSNIRTLGGTQAMSVVSESGLYKITLRAHTSNPKAKRFQDWVTGTVLPAIRKDGAYVMGEEKVTTGEMSEDDFLMKAFEILKRKTERLTEERDTAITQRDTVTKTIGQNNHALHRVAKTFGDLNTQKIKSDLLKAGFLYQRKGTYRVYSKFSHLFIEKFEETYGNVEIHATEKGKAKIVELHAAGLLTKLKRRRLGINCPSLMGEELSSLAMVPASVLASHP